MITAIVVYCVVTFLCYGVFQDEKVDFPLTCAFFWPMLATLWLLIEFARFTKQIQIASKAKLNAADGAQ